MNRNRYPTRGVFAAEPGRIDCYAEPDSRYRYLRPAGYTEPFAEISDCWIVDRQGNKHPGYKVSPMPFHRDDLGERVTD
jgi:hypothetical protein